MSLQSRIQTALSVVYPPLCVGCGDMVASDQGLCAACWRETHFIGRNACHTCGTPVQGNLEEGETATCDECLTTPRPWEFGRAAILYKDKGRSLVMALKHGDRQDLARPAARWMARAGRDLLEDEKTLIAPVPLHWARLLRRRYNQSALLAQALAQETDRAWCPDLLVRRRKTPSLDGLTKSQRFETLAGAMVVNHRRKHRLVQRRVLLVDDVLTSGATLAAAAQACLEAGASHVNVLALARVAKDT